VVRAFALVQDGLGPVGHELHSPSHRRIAQGDAEKVKLLRQIPTTAERLFIQAVAQAP
jgi:hypothetical protein